MIDDVLSELRQRMQKSEDALQDDLRSIRTGRATAGSDTRPLAGRSLPRYREQAISHPMARETA